MSTLTADEIHTIVDTLKITASRIRDAVDRCSPEERRKAAKGTSHFANQYHIDIIADNIVHDMLRGFNGYILSEEREIDRAELERNTLILVVDPIDGSTNASRGLGYWCFSAALISDGEVVAGLVVDQIQNRTFCAVKGEQVTLTDCNGAVILLEAINEYDIGSLADNFSSALINFNSHDGSSVRFRHLRSYGASALAICDVAAGVFDAYIDDEDILLKPWDLLASEYIAIRAGCHVIRRDSEGLFAATGVFATRSTEFLEACKPVFSHFFRNSLDE